MLIENRTEGTIWRRRPTEDPVVATGLAADLPGGGILRGRIVDPFVVAPSDALAAAGDFPPVIDLGEIAPPIGFRIRGDQAFDYTGYSVSDAGDINGDGFADIIIGSYAGYASDNYQGVSYVVYGKADGFANVDLRDLATDEGFVVNGPDLYSFAGTSVSSAGDINGDGFDDLVIGAPGRYGYGNSRSAETYVIFGRAEGYNKINLGALTPDRGFAIEQAEVRDHAGEQVSSAGDINSDGFDDIIISAEEAYDGDGAAYVLFGKESGFENIDLGALAPADGFVVIGAPGDEAGSLGPSLSSAGDVNRDGFDDIILGAPGGPLSPGSGAAYVLFGGAGGFGTVDLAALTPAQGFVIQGDNPGDTAGSSVSSAGDVNGDGFDDVIVGASFNDDGGNGAGAAYVVFGKPGGFADVDLGELGAADGFQIIGDLPANRLGYSVSSAGDVNGDGFDDVIVGAPLGNPDGGYQGQAYVIFGKADGIGTIDVSNLGPDEGFRIVGDSDFDGAGSSVSGAGDINGDGFADMIVGAPNAGGFRVSGDAYVIFGQAPDEAVRRIGAAGDQTIRGGDFDDILRGRRGADTLVGGDGADTLGGGRGADHLLGGSGDDTLQGGDGRDRLTGDAGADDFLLASTAAGDRDTILDFGRGDDRIALDGDAFGLAEGALDRRNFVIGDAAADADDRLIYDDTTGRLFFDADGNGAGAQVQIATLADTPILAASDFIVL